MAEQKKTITVTLQVKEMVFDVMNRTYLTGVSRKAEQAKNYEAAANMQASDDNEHSYQIRRSLNSAFATLKVELGEYLKEDGSTSNNLIKQENDNDGVLTMAFELPSNFNNSSCDALGGGLHEFCVQQTIFDWFTITNKADAADYQALAQLALDRAKKAMYKRERPSRPAYNWQ